MFFFIVTLILTKALPKRVIFSTFALILTKALPKGVFIYFFPYSNQALPKRMFSLLLSLL